MSHLLVALILLYRRFLSGRGALRRVRCTFHHTESCSAFALRTARGVPFWVSLPRIFRRLRRCRDSSIWDLSTPTQRILGWGLDHDRPLPLLLSRLHSDAELPSSIATILATRLAISRHRHDIPDILAVSAARAPLPPAHIILRRGQVHTLKRRVTTSVLAHTATP
jgi:putative component of membrane protein insertase Oxa1/YidC/SpoIIIJ protein YidD